MMCSVDRLSNNKNSFQFKGTSATEDKPVPITAEDGQLMKGKTSNLHTTVLHLA